MVNRSQEDINQNLPIEVVRDREAEFFANNPDYRCSCIAGSNPRTKKVGRKENRFAPSALKIVCQFYASIKVYCYNNTKFSVETLSSRIVYIPAGVCCSEQGAERSHGYPVPTACAEP